MGATQSMEHEQQQRKVTVENPENVGVIQISDSVAERLRSYQQQGSPSPATSRAKPPQPTTPELKDRHSPLTQQQQHHPHMHQQQTPPRQPAPGMQPDRSNRPDETHTTADVEAAVRKVEQFYKKKLAEAEKNASALNNDSDSGPWQRMYLKELEEATREVERKFCNYSYNSVCQEQQDKVLQCYRANPGKTLRCSKEAADFTRCVADHGNKLLHLK